MYVAKVLARELFIAQSILYSTQRGTRVYLSPVSPLRKAPYLSGYLSTHHCGTGQERKYFR